MNQLGRAFDPGVIIPDRLVDEDVGNFPVGF